MFTNPYLNAYNPRLETIKYVSDVLEVEKDFVIGDTPYFTKDLKKMWLKNVKGEIRTFDVTEIIKKDEKDLIIENMQTKIAELEAQINAKSSSVISSESAENNKSEDVSDARTTRKSK